MAAEFQDRLLDALMPAKIKEEPPIVEDVALAAGFKAAARGPARTAATAVVKATSLHDKPNWQGTCGICLDLLPMDNCNQTFFECCCKQICADCAAKCMEYDNRCPLCRTPVATSMAEWLRRLQKHVDEGNADAQTELGTNYRNGTNLRKDPKRAIRLYELAAAQGHTGALLQLGFAYRKGAGAKINQRAAEQHHPTAQLYLGKACACGQGLPQSHAAAVEWFRLAVAQGDADAHYNLGVAYANGQGVLQDDREALRLLILAVAKGCAEASEGVEDVKARLRPRGRPN